MKKKLMTRVATGSVVLLITGIIGGLFIGNYFYEFAISSKTDKWPEFESTNIFTPEEEALAYREAKKAEGYKNWMKNIGFTEEYITSFDGLRLHGYAITNNDAGNKWVIICHGYASRAIDMVVQANRFYEMGFNVLMPDARGLGESEGDYIGMGWDDRRDIVNWTQNLTNKVPDAQIVLYGISMGAATVMMASGEEDLSKNVRAFVEDSGYSSIEKELDHQLDLMFHLPAFPLLNLASLVTYTRAGYWLSEGDVVKQLAKATQPMLFIHGGADNFVPVEMVHEVHDAAPVKKEKLIVQGAGHGAGSAIAPDLYWGTIEQFVYKHIER